MTPRGSKTRRCKEKCRLHFIFSWSVVLSSLNASEARGASRGECLGQGTSEPTGVLMATAGEFWRSYPGIRERGAFMHLTNIESLKKKSQKTNHSQPLFKCNSRDLSLHDSPLWTVQDLGTMVRFVCNSWLRGPNSISTSPA